MSAKAKVKVIKKDQLKNLEPIEKIDKKPKQAAAREMMATVSNWVSDFQQRRRKETKQAIEKFFSTQPKPSEL
jgi:hypothetical protein